jgi:N-acetylglucosaminyldiphosphoundecaprenol N-acetyl-beta-D-mannosaminyltransferase
MSGAQKQSLRCGSVKLSFVIGKFDQVVSAIVKKTPVAGKVVLPCTLYDLSRVEQDPDLAKIYSQVDVCTTDGMPLAWWFRFTTGQPIDRAYGPDMLAAVTAQYPHAKQVFICPNQESLERLKEHFAPQIQKRTTVLELIGDSKDPQERLRLVRLIKRVKPRFVWMGIGSPNQVVLATFLRNKVNLSCTYWCVGAAIPFLAGTVAQAPRWMQRNGLEWLFRLLAEPGRLWRRYLVDTPLVLLRLLFARIRGTM